MTHPNKELLDRYFQAAENGDIATLDELFADDVVGHTAGRNETAGDHHGKQEVFSHFGHVAELSGRTAKLQPRNTFVDDWFAVAMVDAYGQVGQRAFDGEPTVVVARIANGKIVEWWTHHHDQARMDEIWAGAGTSASSA